MNAELMDLGRRAVACKGFRWMSGMLVQDSHGVSSRVVNTYGGGADGCAVADGAGATFLYDSEMARYLPNLSDPATLGPMAALVIGCHPTARIQLIQRIDSGERHAIVTWEASDGRTHSTGKRPTAEALLIALEAAP